MKMMTKELWIKIDKTIRGDLRSRILELASKVCDVIYTDEISDDLKDTGLKIATKNKEADIIVIEEVEPRKIEDAKSKGKKVAIRVTIKDKEDEENAIRAASSLPDYVIVDCLDWKIIPLENLIANVRGKSRLLAEVSTTEEAKIAIETLELGADGVVLKTSDPEELIKTAIILKKHIPKIELTPIKIVNVKTLGAGARACIDTCDIMKAGEGMLVGCQSACLFLVEAEVHENPFVQPRPFRVNAGAVSLYALCSFEKTRYLSELKAGDNVLIVDREGNMRTTYISRVKIEWRPLVLIEAEHESKIFKTILQNAETIRLISQEGSIPVTELKKGDTVLAHVSEGGRHFGTLVKEEKVVEI